ncbi:MAG: 4-hydroxythreonine-4-phosphate dehydrogenase PdxA [Alphaproteobacteria bacterium]|nr:4-hydroxythreonine-4-phosphate dehydrogenase PdxA [Alphaproteobacteria bacterium]
MNRPPLALTCGEPSGIAPEITARAWAELARQPDQAFFLIGDINDFMARTAAVGLGIPVRAISTPHEALQVFAHALPVLHRPLPVPSRAAWIDTRNSNYVIAVVTEAVELCLAGAASGIVTNPIHKDALYSVGFKFQGHTDFLAALAQARGFAAQDVMMLVAADLRAVPITVHIPLKDVPSQLTGEMIMAQAKVVHHGLINHFGIAAPRLAFTGLNPHAGENGAMGDEEERIIIPALQALRAKGLQVAGPLPADTAFHAEARATYDAILCMYHDQALIPVKTLDFHGGVNVTLGLPFIRTSPDHGTALNIAGKGLARPDSMIAALRLAAQMAARG